MSDYLVVLRTVQELPFNVGKRTLRDIVIGATTQKMVSNDAYMDLSTYGELEHLSASEIDHLIDRLVSEQLLRIDRPAGKHYQVTFLTMQGAAEIRNPTREEKSFDDVFSPDSPQEQTKKLIEEFDFFLKSFTDEQKHAIVCPQEKVLCVAGAGSGKTTVLTKRIEFLHRYCSVPAEKILAITFTRKARDEMKERLSGISAHITTFNSFCERLLRRAGHAKPVASYAQKRKLLIDAATEEGFDMRGLVHEYFSSAQRRGLTQEELQRRLLRDVYSIIDHFSNEDKQIPQSTESVIGIALLRIARSIQTRMKDMGVRDYSGQLRDALELLRSDSDLIPQYQHVLVDEYQDVNVAQVELLDLLRPQNLFVVGDPRQSIFGWRGSQVRFITEFEADTTVQLRTNFRSGKKIIDIMNASIKKMGLPDLVGGREEQGTVVTIKHPSEQAERVAVAAMLKEKRGEDIFVLARTNNQLRDLSEVLRRERIPHSVREEDATGDASGVTLSTVHAIKGLEADTVICLGLGSRYFPLKTSDHPVIDLIKDTSYDRYDEELRLLYVALSRARKTLVISYSGSLTYFLDGCISEEKSSEVRDDKAFFRLKEWRTDEAKRRGVPPYVVCTDKTLRDIAQVKPKNHVELMSINGMGPERVKQYGDVLIRLFH